MWPVPTSREDRAGPGSGAPKSTLQIFGHRDSRNGATIIIAYDGRLLTGRHSCLFTAPILSASIKATGRCLTDWAEEKARDTPRPSLSRIFEEVAGSTLFFLRSKDWLMNPSGEEENFEKVWRRSRERVWFASFESLLNIKWIMQWILNRI